jgi:cyclomaltodextrinase / maltogenic alpha-amylase / neopullulanase
MENSFKIGIYRHYKSKDKKYKVVCVAFEKGTMEKQIVYQALYDIEGIGVKPIFVQPLSRFLQEVEFEGKKVPRFIFVRDE